MSHARRAAISKGEAVRIAAGPFSGFIGKVTAVSKDQRRLKTVVGIFGRRPSVELFFLDVQRVGPDEHRRH